MGKVAGAARSVLGVAFLVLIMASMPAWAAEPDPADDSPPGDDSAPAAEPMPAANLECHDKPVTGSGPGFASSREQSEQAAVADWLIKAKTIYPDATWSTAKDAGISCAVQGLYSKCFAAGVPCHPKSAAAPEPPTPEPQGE